VGGAYCIVVVPECSHCGSCFAYSVELKVMDLVGLKTGKEGGFID
jgi:hypothetical protein